ncbi:FAD-dependent oxidoreductase [Pantoea sp. A4]|uniref:FAD-dependent oxidoreductase n=1 Tax=Pantoea sp. A4 TaxID=1225184 RepID=UPI0008FAD923|nr:FAD-dependent oxidoreductase [Pantoea sp. A4]
MTSRIAVVGLGALGCATLLALARKGYAVEGFEQYRVGNDIGASGGRTRQHRLIYGEGAAYTSLLQRASQLWQQLEQEQQTQLFWGGGFLTIGTPESAWFQAVENSAKQQDLPHERLSRAAINARFPRLNLDEDEEGLFDPAGGILLTHELLIASAQQAQQLGAEVHEHATVSEITANETGVDLRVNGEIRRFDRVIVTTGAWSKKLLPALPIASRRLGMSFHLGKESGFDSQAFPPTMRVTPGRAMWNTQPLPDGKNFKFFVGDAELNEQHDPQLVATEATDSLTPLLYQRIDQHVAEAVNGGHRTIVGGGTWPEAYTWDQAPLLGELATEPHVWIGIGLSGHGFKLAPALGELLAQAIAGEVDLARDWPLFSPARQFAEPQAVYSR